MTASDEITLVSAVSVRGGAYAKKDSNNQTVYGLTGTLATLSGEVDETAITVVGSPLAPSGEAGPEYTTVQKEIGKTVVFTASEYGSLSGEEGRIRYQCDG